VIEDGQPRNSATILISRSLRLLKQESPRLWGVLSFADTTEGHVGYVYQAANAIYCGTGGSSVAYRDANGRLRAPRQDGVNVSPSEASRRGWSSAPRQVKHRYLFLIADRRQRPLALAALRLKPEPYPKGPGHATP
jgi:hypothetical protein